MPSKKVSKVSAPKKTVVNSKSQKSVTSKTVKATATQKLAPKKTISKSPALKGKTVVNSKTQKSATNKTVNFKTQKSAKQQVIQVPLKSTLKAQKPKPAPVSTKAPAKVQEPVLTIDTTPTEPKKIPLRRTITRRTFSDNKITKRMIHDAMNALMKDKKIPQIVGLNKMDKQALLNAAPVWALARIHNLMEQQQEQRHSLLATLSDDQRVYERTFMAYTTKDIIASVKATEVNIVNRNLLSKEELVYRLIVDNHVAPVLSYLRQNFQPKNQTTAVDEAPMDIEDDEESDVVIQTDDEVVQSEPEEVEETIQAEPLAVVAPKTNNRQPSAQAIKQAMRLAASNKGPVQQIAQPSAQAMKQATRLVVN